MEYNKDKIKRRMPYVDYDSDPPKVVFDDKFGFACVNPKIFESEKNMDDDQDKEAK